MPRLRATFSGTFEFDTAPPLTHRGEVTGSSIRALYARAADQMRKAFPNAAWRSMVIVLEREAASATVCAPDAAIAASETV